MGAEFLRQGRKKGNVSVTAPFGDHDAELRWVKREIQIAGRQLHELTDPGARVEQGFDHQAIARSTPVGVLDQPFHFAGIQALNGAVSLSWGTKV